MFATKSYGQAAGFSTVSVDELFFVNGGSTGVPNNGNSNWPYNGGTVGFTTSSTSSTPKPGSNSNNSTPTSYTTSETYNWNGGSGNYRSPIYDDLTWHWTWIVCKTPC